MSGWIFFCKELAALIISSFEHPFFKPKILYASSEDMLPEEVVCWDWRRKIRTVSSLLRSIYADDRPRHSHLQHRWRRICVWRYNRPRWPGIARHSSRLVCWVRGSPILWLHTPSPRKKRDGPFLWAVPIFFLFWSGWSGSTSVMSCL